MDQLVELIKSYHQGGSELLDWIKTVTPVLAQGATTDQLSEINSYLRAAFRILGDIHTLILIQLNQKSLEIPEPPIVQGNLNYLVESYSQRMKELEILLDQGLPLIAGGATLTQLNQFQQQVGFLIISILELDQKIQEWFRSDQLSRELLRYRYVLRMAEIATRGEDWIKYEGRNILERWLLNLANDKESGAPDQIFSLAKLKDDYPATLKMKSEFLEKKIDPSGRIDSILKLGREYLNITRVPSLSKARVEETSVQVAEFKFEFQKDRLTLLKSKATDSDIILMVVRLASVLPGSQHWGIPYPIYEHLINRYGVDIEGFASPINSRIIYFNRPNLSFCSLFPETDAPFGSIGTFFETNFTGHSVMANPPFVPEILNKTVKKIQESCSIGSVRFFGVFPKWPDAEFFQKLKNSEYLLYNFELPARKYYYTDDLGNKITTKFDSYFFIIGTPDYQDNYSRLEDEIFKIYRQA